MPTKKPCHIAPLPFQGMKYNFAKRFKAAIQEAAWERDRSGGNGITVVDVFGGSGLLSRTAKDALPSARVVCNERDGYAQRLAMIDETETLRQKLHEAEAECADKQKRKYTKDGQDNIRRIVAEHAKQFGRVDYVTINRWVTFSSKSPLSDRLMRPEYSRVPINPLHVKEAKTWFDGIETINADFRDAIQPFLNDPNAILVLDPPYPKTQQQQYKSSGAKEFGREDFLDLFELMRPPFFFFASYKSGIPQFFKRVFDEQAKGHEKCSENGAFMREFTRVTSLDTMQVYDESMFMNAKG